MSAEKWVALTRPERKFLIPAALYGWRLEIRSRDGKAFWDGDRMMPSSRGPILHSLIAKGFMEKVAIQGFEFFRATNMHEEYRCRADRCYRGRIHDEDTETEKCKECDATGLLLTCAAQRAADKANSE